MKYIPSILLYSLIISCSKNDSTNIISSNNSTNTPTITAQTITDKINQLGDPNKGLNIYLTVLDNNKRACVNCHISSDGFDIMFLERLTH